MKSFFKSLFAAIAGGAIASAAQVVAAGNMDAKHIGTAAAVGAATTVAAFLHPSPIQQQ